MDKPKRTAADVAAENQEAPALIGQATQAQIDGWKRKYDSVYLVEVEGRVAYFRNPDRQVLGLAMKMGGGDPMKFNALVFDNCWLGGDGDIKTVDRLYIAAQAQMQATIDVAEASIKKL